MDPAACRVVYIDDRFNTERWISREGLAPATPQRAASQAEFNDLPADLQANVNAFLTVFNQVFVCRSGRSFSSKLSELHEQALRDCTPILACFDVGAESRHDHYGRARPRFAPASDSPLPSPLLLRREITFSAESDESYGLQLLSRITSDLQVEEGVKLIIPVAVVQPKRKGSNDSSTSIEANASIARAPYGRETTPAKLEDDSDAVDSQLMLQCLDAGALDVVRSPLDKAGIMGLTVHAYRIYKSAKKEHAGFMALAKRGRKQSWVGMEDEKPYAYLREAMVRKLLKGICEPHSLIEDYQHRNLYVDEKRKCIIRADVGKWDFSAHDFTEDELVWAGYYILNHVLQLDGLQQWRLDQADMLRFMQGCRVAYNSFVLYHNFRHAVDVLQSLFYFLLQVGALPPYPRGSAPSHSLEKSAIADLVGPFEALTLLISAIGHDVGHPGVNNMFLVKLNAPLAQLYNDQSVLEAFHCAAYSQILRRHWPAAFNDKAIRKLMISSILATDMGVHAEYMQQLGFLQEKMHETKDTDGWSAKDVDAYRTLTCGLLIKCADISNVARPWRVAEKWTYLLQKEFAHQGEMEQAVGMETTLFGGPPELGNTLKLANGQIGFMGIFAHPLFSAVADLIPAMSFAGEEILTNKGVWFTKAEQEKTRLEGLRKDPRFQVPESGAVSPRTQSPNRTKGRKVSEGYFPKSATPSHLSQGLSADDVDDNEIPENKVAESLAQVKGVATTEGDTSSKRSSRILKPGAPIRKFSAEDRRRSSTPRAADQTQKDTPKSALEAHELDRLALDEEKDNAVSMRAGTEAVPVAIGSDVVNGDSTHKELSRFTFATSEKTEPVRTVDPGELHYPAVHAASRASIPIPQHPFSDLEQQQQHTAIAEEARQARSAPEAFHEASIATTNVRGGAVEGAITPTQSTEGTSLGSDRTDETKEQMTTPESQPQGQLAGSPPQHLGVPTDALYSVGSDGGSINSSKNDVRTTVLSNGENEDAGHNENNKRNKLIGRRRSKLRLNLAFWKKRGSERSLGEDDRVTIDSQQASMSGHGEG